jgi:hypothetical protein
MRLIALNTLVLLFLFPVSSKAFDDLRGVWTVDFLYHYARIERSTLLNADSFQSRQGGMIQFEYEDQIDLFWRWYIGGDFTYAIHEAAASRTFSPREQIPWQLYMGTGFQLGALKSFEGFFGFGGSSEHYFLSNGVNSFSFESDVSARIHAGFSWRFLSVTGATAKLLFRYSYPVTEVDHDGTSMRYRGILDGNIRLRGRYDSLMSLYAGVRFEDYQVADESVVYFTTRVYAGLGFQFR